MLLASPGGRTARLGAGAQRDLLVRPTHLRLTESDSELRAAFQSLRTRRDVAEMLHVTDRELIYLLFRRPPRYRQFCIRKRDGSLRTINAPVGSLKIVQQKLNQVLQAVYRVMSPVHGFARERSVLSNATRHVRRPWVVNVDIEDFFPAIHFGRVMGTFGGRTYRLPRRAAMALAQICCYRGALPQGAPTSPVVSNMVCRPFDIALRRFAANHRCHYTRYADDITLSSNSREVPDSILRREVAGTIALGPSLRHVIESNGFKVNQAKVRMRLTGQRQEVTGLVTNAFPNVPREFVRRVRGMLHAWERFVEEAAQREFGERHDRKQRRPRASEVRFRDVLRGRLEFIRMVKGGSDSVFVRQWNRLSALAPQDYRPVVMEVREKDWVPTALWVIESEEGQGTGFELQGYGLVTCAHCLGTPAENVVAFRAGHPGRRYGVVVQRRSDELDLAILQLPPEAPREGVLLPGNSASITPPAAVELFGFPEYAPGATVMRSPTTITGRHERLGIRQFAADSVVVEGASGGPAVDQTVSVVGIIRTSYDEEQVTRPSLVDIDELERL